VTLRKKLEQDAVQRDKTWDFESQSRKGHDSKASVTDHRQNRHTRDVDIRSPALYETAKCDRSSTRNGPHCPELGKLIINGAEE
jgi:hypothetical protein